MWALEVNFTQIQESLKAKIDENGHQYEQRIHEITHRLNNSIEENISLKNKLAEIQENRNE